MSQRIQRALISVSDKHGITGFARSLSQLGIELLSTGGTHRVLESEGIPVREVSGYTGFPEMMGGRVKTLHPRVHGGILALRDASEHLAAMQAHGILPIDLVVVNLYPFEATVAREGVGREEAIEEIDIGGPAMVRSAAKNHRFVGVVTDPADYGRVLDDLDRNAGSLSDELRRELASKAFALTARYDAAISRWLFEDDRRGGMATGRFPESFTLAGKKVLDLRYGENPHQAAAFYVSPRLPGSSEPSIAAAEVLNGKTLSYNNLVDLDAAHDLAKEFDEPFVCVVKHTNPCGAAAGETIARALEAAWSGDPVSAFGSVLAFTRRLDMECAEFLVGGNRFVEAIVAPGFDEDAFDLLVRKPKWGRSVRLLAAGPSSAKSRRPEELELKPLLGGFLLQERDLSSESHASFQAVTSARPDVQQERALVFANTIAQHVKSNAIVLARDEVVLGVGAGQMSRVDAVRIAVAKAGERASGSVLASDAFFPFPDGVEAAIAAGIRAIVQPGGSVRDAEVIAACDRAGVPMVFTGIRHFRH